LTARDWSGYAKHGTLTNMDASTGWMASSGRYAINFDGSNDFVALPFAELANYVRWPAALSLWFMTRDPSQRQCLIADFNTSGTTITVDIEVSGFNMTTGRVGVGGFLGASSESASPLQSTASISANRWYQLLVQSNATGFELYLDGVLQSSKTSSNTPTLSGSHMTRIGRPGAFPSDILMLNGQVDDVRLYHRELQVREIRQLASRRGIAYELAPRRRSALVSGFNRRRRLLVGAHS
jgi:hypothetical protein